jgi:hypothetical protein
MGGRVTCAACEVAARRIWYPRFCAGCPQCQARELAQSPGFHASMQQGRMCRSYVDNLKAIYGGDPAQYAAGHALVKAAAINLKGTPWPT